jgi:hypothetical protein
MKKSPKYSPEVQERAVRLVLEHQNEHGSKCAPEMVEATIPQAIALDPTLDEAQVTVAMTQVDRVWEQLFPAEQQRLVRLLVERVIVAPTNLELRLRPSGVGSVAIDARQAAEAVA